MSASNLDFIPADLLDLDNYVYRWIKDTPGRLRMATKMDDYDKVSATDLGPGFAMDATDSEGGDTIKMYMGQEGGQAVYGYLCRKPKEFWDEDNEEVVEKREAMMRGRIFEGEATDEDGRDLSPDDNAYVPKGVQMGGSTAKQRNRGPVRKNF